MKSTSIHLKFRPSSVPGHEGSVYFRFIRNREVKVLTTSHKLFPGEWNPHLEKVKLGCSSRLRDMYLQKLSADLSRERANLESNIRSLERSGNFKLADFVEHYRLHRSCCMLLTFAPELEQSLRQSGQIRTARAYRDAARNFIRFNGGQDFPLEQLDAARIKEYETWMKFKGNKLNTISFYMRNLRMIHKGAVERRLIGDPGEDIFAHVFTGVDKTRKRAVKKEVIEDLAAMDFAMSSCLMAFSRDLFILSFYLRGISFIDLAYLKKKNVKNGIITYKRHKTGQTLEIALTPEMQAIIGRYSLLCKDSDYLLPILGKDDSRQSYDNALKKQNGNLKKLSKLLGLEEHLTTYVSRHSWATIARKQGIPMSLISQGLGHESERTTLIYLDSFDYTPLHQANLKVIRQTKKIS